MSSPVVPAWLVTAATILVASGIACMLIVAVDELMGRRHRMTIMNVVWPITMLWSGPVGLWAYFSFGRAGLPRPANGSFPSVAKATTHCGSGCTLGDLIAETLVVFVPITLFGQRIFGAWSIDFALALLFGLAFQYFTIKPMRDLSPGQALVQAFKADVASLTAWQVGMYGTMGLLRFGILHHDLPKSSPAFWAAMQIAMLAGFATAYPVNVWLLAKGIKESM